MDSLETSRRRRREGKSERGGLITTSRSYLEQEREEIADRKDRKPGRPLVTRVEGTH